MPTPVTLAGSTLGYGMSTDPPAGLAVFCPEDDVTVIYVPAMLSTSEQRSVLLGGREMRRLAVGSIDAARVEVWVLEHVNAGWMVLETDSLVRFNFSGLLYFIAGNPLVEFDLQTGDQETDITVNVAENPSGLTLINAASDGWQYGAHGYFDGSEEVTSPDLVGSYITVSGFRRVSSVSWVVTDEAAHTVVIKSQDPSPPISSTSKIVFVFRLTPQADSGGSGGLTVSNTSRAPQASGSLRLAMECVGSPDASWPVDDKLAIVQTATRGAAYPVDIRLYVSGPNATVAPPHQNFGRGAVRDIVAVLFNPLGLETEYARLSTQIGVLGIANIVFSPTSLKPSCFIATNLPTRDADDAHDRFTFSTVAGMSPYFGKALVTEDPEDPT